MKLEIQDIRKTFNGKEVLHGISFNVESGKAMGFIGRNGAGKSTTIRSLMGIFHQDSGEYILDGKVFVPSDYKIGFLPEERGMYGEVKVLEQLIYFGTLRHASKKETKKSALELLERIGCMEYKNAKLKTLSKGNQQKIQIVQSLLNDPDIVILDEPFSGLDPINSQILKELITEIVKKHKLVIFSSHQMNIVEEFCEEVTLINKGSILLTGNLSKIKSDFSDKDIALVAKNKTNEEMLEMFQANNPFIKRGKLILKPNASNNDLLREIMDKGIEIESFEENKPSLEDVFVKVAGDNNEE